ncbi:MAG: hypothetical protein P8Y28_13535, partial [Gammaproteobacteria bacterium]
MSYRILVVAFSLLALVSCGQGTSENNPNGTLSLGLLRLQTADNCDGLKNYITESLIKQYASIPQNTYYYCPSPRTEGTGSESSPPSADTAPAPATDGSNLADGGGSGGAANDTA